MGKTIVCLFILAVILFTTYAFVRGLLYNRYTRRGNPEKY